MHDYAKRLQQKHTQQKDIASSKSDSNIVDSNLDVNHCEPSSSRGNYFLKHDHNHQQCCTGFGTSSKHRFQNNACEIV